MIRVKLDMEKRACRVESIGFAGQTGQNKSFLNGSIGLTRIFQTNFFFFQLQKD